MLWFLEIRKSIIKIQIKVGESKLINKFEILHQNLKYGTRPIKIAFPLE